MKKVLLGLILLIGVSFSAQTVFMSNSDAYIYHNITNAAAYGSQDALELNLSSVSIPTGSTGVTCKLYNIAKNAKLDVAFSAERHGHATTTTISWRKPQAETLEHATEAITSGTDITDFDTSIAYVTLTTAATTANPTVTGNIIYIKQ